MSESVYDLHTANASRELAVKELLLFEEHARNAPCMECMNKHLIKAEAALQEAASLDGGVPGDIEFARKLIELRKALINDEISNPELAKITRDIRRDVMGSMGLKHVSHEKSEHDHDDNPGLKPFGLTKCERENPEVVEKLERCAFGVKASNEEFGCTPEMILERKGGCVNPFAVCRASVKCPQ